MAKQDFTVGVEIVNAEEEGIKKLIDEVSKTAGLIVYQIGERVIVASDKKKTDKELVGIIEDLAFNMGIDNTHIKLVYVDMDSSKIIESQSAVLEFMREYDVTEDDIPISVFPDLMEFMREYKESIDSELNSYTKLTQIEPVAETEYSEVDKGSSEEVEELESSDDDGFKDDVDFDVAPTQSIVEESSEGDSDLDVEEGFKQMIQELEKPVETEKEEHKIDETSQIRVRFNDKNTSNPVEKLPNKIDEHIDPLMKVAIELFTRQHLKQLPVFDELTQRELQEAIVSASYKSEQAKQESVISIYHRLKQQEADLIDEIENSVLNQAKEQHQAVMEKLSNNLEVDKKTTHREFSEKYNSRKQEFINNQIKELEVKYDADNLRNYQEELNLMLENLEKQIEEKIKNEEKRYEDYRNKVIEQQKQSMIESFDVSREVSEYNHIVDSENNELVKEAETFKGQVGNATFEMQQENERLLKQLKELDSQNKIQKETEQQRIESQISMAVADNKYQHEQRETEIKERYEQELEKLKARFEEKEQELSAERKNMASINEALDAKSRDLEIMQLAKMQISNSQQVPIQNQTAVPLATGVQAFKLPRSVIATIVTLAVFSIISLGATIFTIASTHSRATEATTVASEVARSGAEETTSSSFEVGKTYPYTTSSGEKVKLIIDDEQSAHYVDKDGKYHSVLLVN